MILILSLFRISLCDIRVVQDQTRQPYVFSWQSTNRASGVLSKYCPLGINKYLFEQSNEDYYYFLQNGYFGDKQELLYLIYMEIQFEQRLIVFHVQLNLEGNWVECTFPFQPLEVEGISISTAIHYADSGEVFIEQFWGQNNRRSFSFPYTQKPNFYVTSISGGIFSDLNPITKTKIILKQFPGKMSAVITITKQEFKYLWQGLPKYQGSNYILLQKEEIDLQERISNQYYIISTLTQKDYSVSFWAKAQALYDSNFDQILHILRVVANRFTQDFMATGSNSFILDYVYNKQTQKWIFRINFYSYIIPVLIRSIPDNSLLIITKEIIIDNYSYINTWHFISIEYSQNIYTFYFENPQFNYIINSQYENVYQYQLIYYRLFFGGTTIETNSLTRSFAIISFQDYTGSNVKCHSSCQTCFGPFKNNCQSCPPNSNRIYDPKEYTCQCQLWYEEFSEQNCELLANDFIEIKLEDEDQQKDESKINCNFGEFEYNDICYQCPSASQKNQIICSACLMRPTDWIYNNPVCNDIYYQYENNPNYQYVQMITDQEIANQYYIFQNDELLPCQGCKLCQDKLDIKCQLSSYFHLDKETYIQCLQGYYFNNGICIKNKQNLDILNKSCQNNCLKCSDGQCQICSNNINYFLNYMGQCQLCAIKNCKYCFQYNSLNLIENTISRNAFQKTILSDDFEIGCAQCLQGYIYSFLLKQCLPQYNEIDCQSYINDQDELQCYSTKFDQLITKYQQIENCQEQLPNCDQCIYTQFSLLICIKCSQGFYINKVNGLCNKCSDHQALDCQLVDFSQQFQKLHLYGFIQYQTQNLNDLSTIYNDFDHINILECKSNFLVDTIQNQCIDQCTNCDKCAIINGQKQCLKCTISSSQFNYYSQIKGNCYRCPQLCKFCLQIDIDLIEQYNPYFYITESSKTQAMKCIINYDQNLTFIDYLSGLIKPFNNVTNSKQTFSAYADDEIIYDMSNFDDIILKSVSKISYDIYPGGSNIYSLLNYYFSVNNFSLSIKQSSNNVGVLTNIFNTSEVRVYQLNLYDDQDNFNISSNFGVKFYAEDCTFQTQIFKTIFSINQPIITNLSLFNIFDITIQNTQVIIVNSHFQNSKLIFQHFLSRNSTFIDSIFLLHSSDKHDNVFIHNITYINCTFKASACFSQKALFNIKILQMSRIKFINCTFKDSIVFQISENINSFSIKDIQVINCSFYNSSIVSGLQNLRLDQILLNNLILTDSNLFLYSYSTSNYTIIMTHLVCQGLLFNKSTILLIENLQQFIQIDVIIQDWNLQMINFMVTNEIISDNSILIFYNVNSQIKNLIIQKSILFTLFIFKNCQEIILNNIYLSQIENEVQQLDRIGRYKYQRYVIYISEFTYLTITQLQILHWIQTSDPFLIIRSDSQISNFILISELQIEYYSSFNILNYINPAIFIQIDSQIKISIINCNFKRLNFWSMSLNNEMMEAALIRIKSPKSQVILDILTFEIANVYNSFNSIVFVDATTIFMQNTQVNEINNKNTIDQLYSICGFVIFMAEQIRIINTIMNNINSAQYGFIYIQMKQQGNLYVSNCIFNNTKLANTNLYMTQLGGIFTIDGQLSMLQLSFLNITAINIYAEKKAAFLYLFPSTIQNQIFMQNLTFKNLISTDNLFCKLKFPSNSQNNKIVINQIFINNNENSTLLQQLIRNLKKIESGNNYEGLFSSSFSSISVNDFIYEGYLNQPICKLNVINSLKISNLKFVSLSILNQIEYLINIEIQNANQMIIQNFYFEKIHLLYQLEYFLKINYTSIKHPIISNSIYFINNLCPQCQNGFITILNNQNQSKIIITDYLFYNNNCGVNSCLNFRNIQLKIHNSLFINNLGQNNGIIQGIKSILQLKNNILKNNQIVNKSGALFLNESIIDAQNLIIVNNSANIGGAIYCENSKVNKQTRRLIQFQENYGFVGLNNIKEQGDFLKLNMFGFSINNTRQIQNNQIFDTPSYIINHNQMRINNTYISVGSGQKLNEFQVFDKILKKYSNYTIQLQIEQYTQLGEKIINDQGDKCLMTQFQVNSDLNQTNDEIISQSQIQNVTLLQFDTIWESYKLDNFSFYLDPYSNQQIFLLILIKCDRMPQNYNFIFQIKTLPCEIGEYYNNKQCLKCDYDKGYYSVRKNSIECQRLDPTKMKSVTSYQIELLTGFWRYSYYSHYVDECENSAYCLGGWNVDYESCSIGYIGAICNECDIYNIRGQSSYIKSLSGVCQKKEKQQEIFLITFILMLFIFIITYVISILKSEMHIMYKRMKQITIHYKILFQCEIDQLNTSIKLLINFMQILYPILSSLKFSDDIADIADIAWPIGKSSKTLLYLVNFVADEFEIEILYLKMVWAILIPIIQISILLFFYTIIKRIINNSHIQLMFIQASCIFLLFYSMPNIMEELIIVIQKRTIVNIDWIGANIAYQYQTEEHQNWIWQFVVPSISLIFLVIPIIFFTFIYKKNNKQINFDISYGIYGYLCSDYKQHLYYWELVNLQMKLTLIFIIFFLDNNKIILKNLIVIVILLGYYASISTLKPFQKQNLNHLEKFGIILCCVFISLNILTLASQKYSYIEVQYLTQILMLLILLLILIYTLIKIMKTFFNKYQDLFDKIRISINIRYPNIKNYCSFFKIHLKLRSESKRNIINKFKRIKSQLRLMKLNNTKIIRNPINIHDELMSNIQRSDRRQLIQQYSVQNSFMF